MAGSRLEWTSVPRWPAPVLSRAASYLACWFGAEAERAVRALLADADPGVPTTTAAFAGDWNHAVEAELRRLIGGCRMGVRIIVAGPEALVMRSVALARELGASDEELIAIATEAATALAVPVPVPPVTHVSGVAQRRVYCAPCAETFDAVAALGGTVTCPGCAARLTVDHRFSRPRASYFGWPGDLDLHQ